MKKILLLAILGVTGIMISGCTGGYVANTGFGAVPAGLLYSETAHGSFIAEKAENLNGVQVLGNVRGESMSTNILFVVSTGDSSIETAKRQALMAYPNADDIINIEVDTKHRSIMCFYNTITTVLRGKAIKYNK